jgi:hypothetical protein
MPAPQSLNYFLSGEITSLEGEPLNSLTVRAYNKDPVSPDDLLARTVTDENGMYKMQFTTKDFQVAGFERSGPDVYINVFCDEDLLGISKIQKNSAVNIRIDLKVDYSSIRKDSGSGKPLPLVETMEELDAAKLKRLNILNAVTRDVKIKEAISNAFKAAQGNWSIAKEALKKTGTDIALLNKLDFINSFADLTNHKQNLVNVLVDLPGISSLRDLALTHNTKSLAAILEKNPLANNNLGDSKTDASFSADGIMLNVFAIETSAVLQRMAATGELPIDKKLSDAVAGFLSNQPEFNIRTTSIYNALKHPEAFKDIAETDQEAVTAHLMTLQRVQAVSSSPEAVAALMNANLLSAYQVAEMPQSNFVRILSGSVGEAEATKIHARATNVKVRNEQVLINLSESVKGTNIAAIDGTTDKKGRMAVLGGTTDMKARIAELNCCLDKLYKLLAHNKEMLINCENVFIHHSGFWFHQMSYLINNSTDLKHVLAFAIDTLFLWAKPVSAFDASNSIANGIRLTKKAKYNETDWEQVVKPLHDKLREDQRDALVSYLLEQQPFTFLQCLLISHLY